MKNRKTLYTVYILRPRVFTDEKDETPYTVYILGPRVFTDEKR
jgi:hypothetical protein